MKIPSSQNWKKRLKFLIKHPDWPNQKHLIANLVAQRAYKEFMRPNGYQNALKRQIDKKLSDMEVLE